MKKSYIKTATLLLLFFLLGLFFVYRYYEKVQQEEHILEKMLLQKEIDTLTTILDKAIKAKQKATNAIALSLVFDSKIPQKILKRDIPANYTDKLIENLRSYTLYKNIWIQLYNKDAEVLFRSWVDDTIMIESSHKDALKYLNKAPLVSFFDVGSYDLTINSAVALYNEDREFIGAVEVMSHFNSISKKMQKYGVDSLVIVDKIYKSKIKHPFTNLFLGDYYIANLDAKQRWIEYLLHHDITKILEYSSTILDSYLFISIPLKNIEGGTIAHYVMIKDIAAIQNQTKQTLLDTYTTVLLLFMFATIFSIAGFAYYIKNVQKNYYKSIIDNSPNIVIISDGKQTIEVNKTFLRYFGFKSIDEYMKKASKSCLNDYFINEEGYLQTKMDGKHWFEYVLEHANKSHKAKMKIGKKIYYFLISVAKVESSQELYNVIMSDITKEEEYRLELERSSVTDFLTGIKNRKYFALKLQEEIAIAQRYGRPFSLILLDIDHFKQVNDKYGHDIGDEVLKEYANLIEKNLRELDILCRTGGEEFAIILPETTLKDAVQVAKKLNRVVREHKKIVPITISLGVVEYQKGESQEDIYKRADTALYKAKNSGRDRVVIG